MERIRLGRTGITVNKNGFGALPVQRVDMDAAKEILCSAYERGWDFYDTARSYSDSEEKLGEALGGVRDKIVLATKTPCTTAEGFWHDLETSLRLLKTNYVDIYQFHNPAFCPKPGDGSGLYEAMLEAREKGLIRFIGITNHRLHVAREAVESGLYDTLQFPFNYLAGEPEHGLVRLCAEKDVGFIAMKGLSGGLIQDAGAAYGYMLGYPVLPIWGIQRMRELDEFCACEGQNALTEAQRAVIERDREMLVGEFCRGCAYCMPCPAGIEINNCARMSLLLRRSPPAGWLTEDWQAKMEGIKSCINCGKCKKKCPYGLDTPALLQRNLADYLTFL